MMKRLILSAFCIAMIAATADAANVNIRIPTDQATFSAAVAAANDGDTITFTNSATYVGNVTVNKPNLKIVALTGQTPTIQSASAGTTTTPTLLFGKDSGGTKFGSLDGGQIHVNFVKQAAASSLVFPTGYVKFGQSTDTLVTMENVVLDQSGPADGSGVGPTAICTDTNSHNRVTLRYVDINTSHSITTYDYASYGIIFGNGVSAYNTGYPGYLYNSRGGPTYTMDHVRIKWYCMAGIVQCQTSTTLNMSYCDVGVLGDSGREPSNTNRPWGSFNQSGVANAATTMRIDHSLFKGSRCGNNVQIDAAGTSISVSRSVFMNNLYSQSGSAGIFIRGVAAYAGLGGKTYVNADHCDFVGLSTASTLFTGSALVKTLYPVVYVTTSTLNVPIIAISNSNVYADYNTPIFFGKAAGASLTTDHTNVYTGGTGIANLNYTAGTGDKARDPGYTDAPNCDFRYSDNVLKGADSAGGPVGVNGNYADPWHIIDGTGPVSRAHGWTTLK